MDNFNYINEDELKSIKSYTDSVNLLQFTINSRFKCNNRRLNICRSSIQFLDPLG